MWLYSQVSSEFRVLSDLTVAAAKAAGFTTSVGQMGRLVEADCDAKGSGWHELIRQKVDRVLDILGHETHPFVWADADVDWFRPAVDDVLKCLGDHDIVFQCDWWGDRVPCQGLFVARPNERVVRFFEDIRDGLTARNDDQQLTRELLSGPYPLKWDLLPTRYWTRGAHTGSRWKPGLEVNPPTDIVAHHANWVVGSDNKLSLLRAVREKVRSHAG